jgi:RHS repeat-associated protein
MVMVRDQLALDVAGPGSFGHRMGGLGNGGACRRGCPPTGPVAAMRRRRSLRPRPLGRPPRVPASGRGTPLLVPSLAAITSICALALPAAATSASLRPPPVTAGVASPEQTLASGGKPAGTQLIDPLVIPSVDFLVGGQQRGAARRASLASPDAVQQRTLSRSAYRGLGARRARALAARTFPGLLENATVGTQLATRDAHVLRYAAENAAEIEPAHGKHALLLSTQPVAAQTSTKHYAPLNLSLHKGRGGFWPQTAAAPLRIPARLGNGIYLPASHISLVPSTRDGSALPDLPGAPLGADVLYANAETDSDILVKPTPGGVDLSTILRSARSPEAFYLRVAMPRGARLGRSQTASGGPVQVRKGSRLLATIAPPTALDSEGTPVPVSMTEHGDLVVLRVAHRAGSYRYPIAVDPTVEENINGNGGILYGTECKPYPTGATWGFYAGPGTWKVVSESCPGSVADYWHGPMPAGDYAFFYYKTQGASRIYKFTATTSFEGEGATATAEQNVLGIENVHSKTTEATHTWLGPYSRETTTVCALTECSPGKVESGNQETEVFYEQLMREETREYEFESYMASAVEYVLQEAPPTVTIPAEEQQIWHGGNTPTGVVNIDARDPGVGLLEGKVTSPSAPGLSKTTEFDKTKALQHNECAEPACGGKPWEIGMGGLPTGEDPVEVTVTDAAGLTGKTAAILKVDESRPYNLSISSLPHNEIGFGVYKVTVGASEGKEARSSGIASMSLKLGGKEVEPPHGSCSPGPCSVSRDWTIVGSQYATGKNSGVLTVTSGAGETAELRFTLTIHAAEPLPLGPGTVNPASGALVLSSTDVAIAAPGAPLTVERSYDSRQSIYEREGSPFGQPWQGIGITGVQGLTKLPNGSVLLTAASGEQSIFAKEGAVYASPPGDGSLTLTEVSSSDFTLKDERGDVTTFTPPQGGTGTELTPTRREIIGRAGASTFSYETVSGVTRPVQELAPVPAGVSCTTLVRGCRALQFVYATRTTATGEAPGEWGEYTGRLTRVNFTAYNPATAKMQATAVAEYAYDAQGRLRAAWDPRVSPPLKTTYGYDAGNDVTAVTSPGEQPWLINYGTTVQDTTGGKVVSVARPPASSAFGDGHPPTSTEAPQLSITKPTINHEVTVSTGQWSNTPLTYSYQWERCNEAGAECAVLPGAIDQGYVPRPEDGAHTLLVIVTASNASGATAHASAISGTITPTPHFVLAIGEWGIAPGDFRGPSYINASQIGGRDRAFVSDTGNNRVQEFELGSLYYEGSFGALGSGKGQFKEPTGVNSEGKWPNNLIIADSGNKRTTEYAELGSGEAEQSNFTVEGSGALAGTAIINGHALVAQDGQPSRLACRCRSQGALEYYGSSGTGAGQFNNPAGLAVGPANKDVYVVDSGNNRVEYFTTKEVNNTLELTYAGAFGAPGSGPGDFNEPKGIAAAENGNVWVVDSGNDRVQEFGPSGQYITEFGEKTSATQWKEEKKETQSKREARERAAEQEAGPGQFYKPIGIATKDNSIYVVDSGDSRLEQWSEELPSGEPLPQGKGPTAGNDAVWTLEYEGALSGQKAPYNVSKEAEAAWAQKDTPTEATAVFPPDEPMGWPATDYKRATIYYRDDKDREVNTAQPSSAPSGAIATSEYNAQNNVTRTLSADNRQTALEAGASSAATSETLDRQATYNTEGTELLTTLGPQHTIVLATGKKVAARSQVENSYEEGAPAGGPYMLDTKTTESAAYEGKKEDGRTTTRQYSGQNNLGWSLRQATSITNMNPEGLNAVHTVQFNSETGQPTEERKPANPNAPSPHATQEIYYGAPANAAVPACGEHAEWANLPCETRPAVQPETPGVANPPVTIVIYNIWDEPETTTETVGASTRTATTTYDTAGRESTATVTATAGGALPTVEYEYSPETGRLTIQRTKNGGTTRSVHTTFNALGQLSSYTDADGQTASYSYDIGGRPETIVDGRATQTFSYNPTTGLPASLQDSAAGTFTASYDLEGNPTSVTYPNGLEALTDYNTLGEPIALEYKKTSNCEGKACTWLSEEVVPTIHGQTAIDNSSLAKNTYSFDPLGRLVKVKNTPAGKGCITRIYAYDADTNRASRSTYEPSSTGGCSTKTGVTEKHTYDEADRLTDAGVSYNTFGDITALPENDGGGAALTSGFYVDNQLQTITQRESATQKQQQLEYSLDPTGRTREVTGTGQIANASTVFHYDGHGDAPSWAETTTGEWTRNLRGIDGGLVATQSSGATPVLELADLHGNIIATASMSETATAPTSTTEPSEYGAPTTNPTPKYSWLGAIQVPTELPSGFVAMGVRSYIAPLGRFLQPDPVPTGSANIYTYTFGDPLDTSDPSGEYTIGGPSEALIETAGDIASEAAAEQAAINAALRREIEERQRRQVEEDEARNAAAFAASQAEFWSLWNAGNAAFEAESPELAGGGEFNPVYLGGVGHTCYNHKKCRERRERRSIGVSCSEIEAGLGGAAGGLFGGALGQEPGAILGGAAGAELGAGLC